MCEQQVLKCVDIGCKVGPPLLATIQVLTSCGGPEGARHRWAMAESGPKATPVRLYGAAGYTLSDLRRLEPFLLRNTARDDTCSDQSQCDSIQKT